MYYHATSHQNGTICRQIVILSNFCKSWLEILSANVNPREKRGESYPREITRLTQLNSNQLWRELERMTAHTPWPSCKQRKCHLANDWLLVPAFDVVPLDAVVVEVVEDPNATLVLPALLGLPVQTDWDAMIWFERFSDLFTCYQAGASLDHLTSTIHNNGTWKCKEKLKM